MPAFIPVVTSAPLLRRAGCLLLAADNWDEALRFSAFCGTDPKPLG